MTPRIDQNWRDTEVADPQASAARRNPCMDYVPKPIGYDDSMDALTFEPCRQPDGFMSSDAVANFATSEQARLLQAIIKAIHYSTRERNPCDFEFQKVLLSAAQLVADTEDEHGHTVDVKHVSVKTAGSRGHFVSIPEEMGTETLIKLLQAAVGDASVFFNVDTPHGRPLLVNKVQSAVFPFPPSGNGNDFIDTALSVLDDTIGTSYAEETTGPLRRTPREVALALASIAIQHNIGVVFVPYITVNALTSSAAHVLLGALGLCSRLCGLPIVCVGSPGAAAKVVELGGNLAPLYSKGEFHITPLQPGEYQWELMCEHLWANYFARWFGPAQHPDWFFVEMWTHTEGFTGVATKLARYVYELDEVEEPTLTKEILTTYASKALLMEKAPLKAVKHVRLGRPTTRIGARRYGDWLPTSVEIASIPGADESYLDDQMMALIGDGSWQRQEFTSQQSQANQG
ncbi:hypothetical protein [Caballeronia sp. NCTM5]|uniref:hypothetical protein n=1 Tax=Caballeronia sp. NCTM5 TaxID=2921755 RepID=UPI0020286809|nr:hypothetical protein [Caballeronia sp. NCTM5]